MFLFYVIGCSDHIACAKARKAAQLRDGVAEWKSEQVVVLAREVLPDKSPSHYFDDVTVSTSSC